MKKKVCIGIDFSKKTFDVSVIHHNNPHCADYQQFANNKEGCTALLKWIKSITKEPPQSWLFCGEHTGLYSLGLTEFLIKKSLFIWLENPLQIKMSSGIKRDKNDKVDSREIARYAHRHQDDARAFQLPTKALQSLDILLSERDRLLSCKHLLLVAANEIRQAIGRNATARAGYERAMKNIERINKDIKTVEKEMIEAIESDEQLAENYRLITSIKGIALINTAAILVATQNFTRFDDSRQFACYAGMAPFGKQSGTSINGRPRVSHLANKNIKALLTQAARAAINYDPNIKKYYERKLKEGKDSWLIVNNIRNKMIHIIFAIVRNKQPYQLDYSYRNYKTA